MAKPQVSFVCQECGYDSPAYLGKCPECGNWNTFKEFHTGGSIKGRASSLQRGNSAQYGAHEEDAKPQALSTIVQTSKDRMMTGFSEMDSVLGGGIVKGSATLLAGDPGIGKSTLLLQLCLNLAAIQSIVLYISAEESKEQVAMRANRLVQRLGENEEQRLPENLLLLSITNVDEIVRIIEEIKPGFVVVDSIQTVESQEAGGMSGSISQIRYSSSQFIRLAKSLNIPIFLVGHVTKEGMVAGPMVLSHMVDTVLFLEGEKMTKTRILRSFKNRFGPVDEVGIFQMEGSGMVEVKNPEQIFLSEETHNIPGSVLVVIMEGSRPFLIEIQALVVYSKFPMPKRVASGLDTKRVELLLAVLQKHAKLPLEQYDVFVNVAGGIKVSDRAVDLGICLAIFSSLKNKPLPKTVGIAEVGLLGELRRVGGLDKRMKEAKKLGFTTIITRDSGKTLLDVLTGIGYTPGKTNWKMDDDRHFTIPKEEE